MRPDLVDADSTSARQRDTHATPQIVILVAALTHLPALTKIIDQIVTVCASDKITHDALTQL